MKLVDRIKIFPIKLAEIESLQTAKERIQNSYYFRTRIFFFKRYKNKVLDMNTFTRKSAIQLAKAQINLEDEIYNVANRYVKSIIGGK